MYASDVIKIAELKKFQKEIWNYYRAYGREMPWRNIDDPYRIVLSEIMLQQTQVDRVRPKYEAFLAKFPTLESLASAPLSEVLIAWQGLGYNRRAKFLKAMAEQVVSTHGGRFPDDPQVLRELPGIGPGTAGSIAAFVHNKPVAFIETNIRRVYIHFFFKDREAVVDKEILPLVEATVDHKNSREWYYALMDYGALLAKTQVNPNRRSKHYAKQSKFEGSDRQIRGRILKELMPGPKAKGDLVTSLGVAIGKCEEIIQRLADEGFITIIHESISLL